MKKILPIAQQLSRSRWLAPLVIVLGCVALAARPAASMAGLLVIVAVGIAGAFQPLPRRTNASAGPVTDRPVIRGG
jgi:hypothetical protein